MEIENGKDGTKNRTKKRSIKTSESRRNNKLSGDATIVEHTKGNVGVFERTTENGRRDAIKKERVDSSKEKEQTIKEFI